MLLWSGWRRKATWMIRYGTTIVSWAFCPCHPVISGQQSILLIWWWLSLMAQEAFASSGRQRRLPCDRSPLRQRWYCRPLLSSLAGLRGRLSRRRAPSLCCLPACLQQQASLRKWTKAHCRRLPCPIFFTSSKVNTQIPRKKPPVHQTWLHSHSSCLPIKFVFRP